MMLAKLSGLGFYGRWKTIFALSLSRRGLGSSGPYFRIRPRIRPRIHPRIRLRLGLRLGLRSRTRILFGDVLLSLHRLRTRFGTTPTARPKSPHWKPSTRFRATPRLKLPNGRPSAKARMNARTMILPDVRVPVSCRGLCDAGFPLDCGEYSNLLCIAGMRVPLFLSSVREQNNSSGNSVFFSKRF